MLSLAGMVESFRMIRAIRQEASLKVTIEIEGDDVSRLLQATIDRNESIGSTAKQLLHAALNGMPLMDERKATDRPRPASRRHSQPKRKKRRA